MPRDRALTLADLTIGRIAVVCARCPRRGSYSVARLRAAHGDIRLPDLLAELSADCPKRQSVSWTDRCGVRFGD